MPSLDRDPVNYRRVLIVLARALIGLIISHHDYRTYIWLDPEASVKIRFKIVVDAALEYLSAICSMR